MPQKLRNERAKKARYHVTDEQFHRLTDKIKGTYSRLDQTRCDALRLEAELLEVAEEIGLEPKLTQEIITRSSICLETMRDTRKNLVAVHNFTTGIRMQTNQAERGVGCYGSLDKADESKPDLRVVA